MAGKILVVDDEPDVVELIAFRLRSHGYTVDTAHNGLDALFKARRKHPDLIILDVMMDGIDGLSVCEILRAQPSTRTIPVIILTAATGEIARVNSFAAGAADFLNKPFSMNDLMRGVARLLTTSPKQKESVKS
ncbi:MAG TPA: response regulator [Candidatus Acidoferrum sp.]|nr:response regulator [Candidatus Acidoferrum sp.]